VSEGIELIYNRLVAEEKLKSGTPFERLAAITFKLLTEETTVHDLKLRGESTVAHQIDVTVGDAQDRKRILIECKDYGEPVGLEEVRSFWAVVDDLNPDAAYIVTTNRFTEPAETFAKAKGIKAAVLRPPRDDDWEGIVRRIELTISMSTPLDDPWLQWHVDPSTPDAVISAVPQGSAMTESLWLLDAQGTRRPAKPEIEPILSPPLDFEGEHSGTHRFSEPTWLQIDVAPPLKVSGFSFRQPWGHANLEVVRGEGIAGLTAELALRTLDDSIRRIFSNRDLQQWTFDEDGKVVPRPEGGRRTEC
jgi:hypothetical protein